MGFVSKLLSFGADKDLKRYWKTVDAINGLEPKYQAMDSEELQDQTRVLRERLATGETLDDLLPDAFAVVREASRRTLGLRHLDVQLIGGMALHDGMISEMKTGEGKTLVSTLAGYLNALAGKGVHIVTVNDYLANDALNAAFDLGIRVPEELAITGFGNLPICEKLRPALTTVDQHAGLIGQTAARLLMERITGNETGPCRELLVPANPVYRQSCGCAL